MTDFSNKVVLVTGASGGIGRSLCSHFKSQGAQLIALDRVAEVVELADATTHCVQADISDADSISQAVQQAANKVGPIDILVNNAGLAIGDTLAKTTLEDWQQDIDVNLNGVYYCTRAVLASMQARQQGVIVTISSVNALTAIGNPAYSAAKAGLISFTKSLAVEYGKYAIRANIVCPGTVQTPVWRQRVAKNPEIFEQLKKWYPLGRIAEPIDIAKAVAFLASDDARVITGTVLTVDAGLMAGNALLAAELTLEEF